MNTKKNSTAEIQAKPGKSLYPGVRKTGNGYEFTTEVPPGNKASLLLYGQQETETTEIPFPEESRQGSLVSVHLTGLKRGEIQYNYCIEGEIQQDSYAHYLCNTPLFGEKADFSKSNKVLCCGYREMEFAWSDQGFRPKKLCETILYKLQVRSFTMHKHSRVRKKGTFQGLEQKIPYLQELGVTGILLMPAYEFREIMRIKVRGNRYQDTDRQEQEPRINCWGYTGDACYFAPKAGFCASDNPEKEFQHMVNALHEAGLECLMEFYFDGSTSPSVMLDILRYWKIRYHIDGFHLMGEGICRELFMKDSLLSETKLFFHSIDGAQIWGGQKPFFKNGAEYNEGFLYCMRHLLKGDENAMEEFIFRSKRNPLYNGVVNYMADQDGFTMMDMVSYETRHNEANLEENEDGVEYNCSWNCGVEGPSRKQSVKSLRLRQLKNAFSMLLFSQGTPLIFQGDEWGNTQKGNNNVWCQDNELGWIDWNGVKTQAKLLEFVKKAIAFRKSNPMLHMEEEPKGMDYKALGYPDVSYHGGQAWYVSMESSLRYLGIMYCGDYCGQEREFLFLACNFHWIPHELALPGTPEEIRWQIVMRTDEEKDGGFYGEGGVITEKTISVPPRTMIILTGKQDEKACGAGNILRRLQGTSF